MTAALKAILLAVIAALLVLNGLALRSIDGDGKTYPAQWDAPVAPLAEFVEDHRHLRFDHAVKISYLTPKEYRARILRDSDEALTAEDKADVKRFTAQLRALGLIDKDTDLLEDSKELQTGGTSAFYDPESEDIVVYGTKIDVTTQVTLVHEMTHALQDQHFDLSRRFDDIGANDLYKALGEGDASRIEAAYVEKLSEADRQSYVDSFDDSADEHDIDVSTTLEQLFGAPYALGEPMTALYEAVNDTKALDRLFQNPVPSDEGLLNIFALLDAEEPKRVSAPKLNAGEKLTDEAEPFSAIAWYLMLATHIDEPTALRAVDGWGGDSSIGYSAGGRDCIRAAFVGDNANDTTEMHAALDKWKTAFSADRVEVNGDATRVEMSACEPDIIPSPRAGSENSLVMPVARLQFLQGAFESGATRGNAECFSREFVKQVTMAALLKANENPADFQLQARALVQTCAREQAA